MIDRFPLAHLPTPLEELHNLSRHLGGPRIFMKRDDQTGFALGGNKVRKLEYLIADALRSHVDTIITAGAAQSNHCRQTAAAASKAGLECVLVLGGEEPDVPGGNLLLDRLFGARVVWTGMDRRGEKMEEIAAEVRAAGKTPYVIPYGGSNGIGALGYVSAMRELVQQVREIEKPINHVVVASSSGGTQAGLSLGALLSEFQGEIVGISIDKGERGTDRFETDLATIANASAEKLGISTRVREDDFIVEYGYLGGGYGVVGDLERDAISLSARKEGIVLDPVYTGRSFGAMVDLIKKKRFDAKSSIVFWHTGGAPALFAYAPDLLKQ